MDRVRQDLEEAAVREKLQLQFSGKDRFKGAGSGLNRRSQLDVLTDGLSTQELIDVIALQGRVKEFYKDNGSYSDYANAWEIA